MLPSLRTPPPPAASRTTLPRRHRLLRLSELSHTLLQSQLRIFGMREAPKLITEQELLTNLENCLAQLNANSKQFEVVSAIKQNIELRRENMRILKELENVKSANRALLRRKAARKLRIQRRKARKLKIKARAMRRLSLGQGCQSTPSPSPNASDMENPA